MIDLNNPKLSFILISSDSLDDMMSILWAKNFQIIPIKGYYKGQYEDSAMAFAPVDNDELRKELIFLLNHSTVTDLAKFLGWSTLQSLITAI